MHDFEELMTLSQAAKIVPNRPSANTLWRWCRRGVLSRAGERVYLRHVRVGGLVHTTKQWLDDFGHTLAAADAEYFRRNEGEPPPPRSDRERQRQRFEQHRRDTVESANEELKDAGL